MHVDQSYLEMLKQASVVFSKNKGEQFFFIICLCIYRAFSMTGAAWVAGLSLSCWCELEGRFLLAVGCTVYLCFVLIRFPRRLFTACHVRKTALLSAFPH